MATIELMDTKERHFDILDYIIRDYIETAEPVSSARISKIIRFEASPATVRHTMADLNKEGYLSQPHTSAGRIPTDKAYRYFVDNRLHGKKKGAYHKNILSTLEKPKDMHDFIHALAEDMGVFTFLGTKNDAFFSAGIEEIFEEPEFEDYDVARAFASFVEHMPDSMDYYFQYDGRSPHIVIGKEMPFPDALHFSSVIGRPNNKTVIVSVGPKRMDYDHITSIINDFLNE